LLLGILLARSRVRGWIAHVGMSLLGIPVSIYLGMLLTPANLFPAERYQIITSSWRIWLEDYARNQPSEQIFPFVMQLVFLLWLFAYFAAWFIYRRRQVWGAIVFPGLALVVNLFQTGQPQTALYLGIFVFAVFLLLIRFNLLSLERVWRQRTIGYAADIAYDFFLYGAFFAGLLISLGWILPARAPGPSWFAFLDPLQTPWHEFEGSLNRAFNGLNPVGRPLPNANFSSTLLLGGPINLGQKTVMEVQSDVGHYWRAAVYDKYTGLGWINSHNEPLVLNGNDARLNPKGDFLRKEITQTIRILSPNQNILYAAAQPIYFDAPIEIRYARFTDEATPVFDIAVVRLRRELRGGDKYTVVSAISVADIDSLRQAPRDYPDWIANNYLGLPATLPQRVREKAYALSQDFTNPYDQATAIETYLRAAIKYNESVTAPPPDRDGVDYLLFDHPEGYCNYYASAMVVLARAIGIPARVASGFSLGDNRNGIFYVLEANAHAWPELFFPGYGWIEFEPTASQPLLERARRNDPTINNENDPNLADRERRREANAELPEDDLTQTNSSFNPFLFALLNDPASFILPALGLLTITVLSAFGFQQWRHGQRLARLASAAQAYEELLTRAEWIGLREPNHATPYEIAQKISRVIPRVETEIQTIAWLYVRERFGARALSAREFAGLQSARRVIRTAWIEKIWQHILARVIQRLNRIIARVNEFGERPTQKPTRHNLP
ncbi:MAG: DUF4129 domain-containing protein, partial [Chloroflexi bacterium]|nr:DUF4129 domain-containing protein [Chloroflexota bacterium]